MLELHPADSARIGPLLPASGAGHMPFIRALLENRAQGAVLVDDLRRPATALACTASGSLEAGTQREYRRRGPAMVACDACARMCERRGLRPAWACAAANIPSDRMAAGIGYPLLRTISGYPVTRGLHRAAGRWTTPRPRSRSSPDTVTGRALVRYSVMSFTSSLVASAAAMTRWRSSSVSSSSNVRSMPPSPSWQTVPENTSRMPYSPWW